MTSIQSRLNSGELLILDGAIGTELERRGAPKTGDAAWAQALGTNPELISAVHRDYIRAGATVITANTYSTGTHVLEKIGAADKFESWNRLAVDLALQARDEQNTVTQIYVAGSVSGFGNGVMRYAAFDGSTIWGESETAALRDNFRQQCEVLVRAGVDVILLELLYATPEDIAIAVSAIADCELPVWISLSAVVDEHDDKVVLDSIEREMGSAGIVQSTLLADLLPKLGDGNCEAMLVMHSRIDAVLPTLAVMRGHWPGPLGAYPNRTGHWNGNEWVFTEAVTPARYLGLAKQWTGAGAQIVGGCCGFGPEHIAALRGL